MTSPNNSASSTARPSKQYFCDCSRYCKSRQVQVSCATYQRHARFRQADVEKRLACFRTDDHLSTVGTLQLQATVTGPSNGMQQQLGRPMNGADIVQPCVTVDTAGCGVSDDTTLEAQLRGSDLPEVCSIHSPMSSKLQQYCRAP